MLVIRTIITITTLYLSYCESTKIRHTESTKSNGCLSGLCVPLYLCVNGKILTSGANLLESRIDSEDDTDHSKICNELEICCTPDDGYDNNSAENVSPEFDEITETESNNDSDNNYDYNTENLRPKCGIRNSNLQPRFSRDDKANDMEFPWMVMVLKKMPESSFYDYQCGGSLIHPSAVLTAAHCVSTDKSTFLHVRAGEWDMANINEPLPHQDREIQSIVIHHAFYKPTLLNDIAILILRTPVQLADNVNTVCLPSPPKYLFDNERCLVTGWGKNRKGRRGKYQTKLKKIELPIVPNKQCQKQFRKTVLGNYFRLDKSFICAGGEFGKDTCQGDGGSPLVCQIPNATNFYYQSGIVSWGIGCKQSNIPGAYVNVARYRDWIDKVMRKMNLESSFYTFKSHK